MILVTALVLKRVNSISVPLPRVGPPPALTTLPLFSLPYPLAPVGHLLRLDFRDYFHIEPSEECKFDYIEVGWVRGKGG